MSDSTAYNQKELLQRIAEGDERAFKTLFYAVTPSLQKSIEQMTNSYAQTQEIIQETFIKIWLNRDSLDQIDNIQAYLYRIAVNLFVTKLRKETATKAREKNYEAAKPLSDTTAEEQMKLMELKEVITKAVDQLPEKRKQIYRLSRDKGMSTSEIAAQLQIAESTVKNSISTALSCIREKLVAAGFGSLVEVVIIILSFFSGQ